MIAALVCGEDVLRLEMFLTCHLFLLTADDSNHKKQTNKKDKNKQQLK